jgi:hypothetical protein
MKTIHETPPRPRLPRSPASGAGGEGFAELRRFHLGAPGATSGSETEGSRVGEGLLPALLHPFRGALRVRSDYPLFLTPVGGEAAAEAGDAGPCLAFSALLERLERTLEGEGRPMGSLLRDNLRRLERHAAELAARESKSVGAPVDARALLAEAGAAMVAELGLAEGDRDTLEADLERTIAALPEGGRFLGAVPGAALDLARQAILVRRRAAREAFAREARDLAARAEAILEADRLNDPERRKAESPETIMGRPGGRFFDPSALAGVLGERRGSEGLDPARRKALETSLEALRRAAREMTSPTVHVVHDGSVSWHLLEGGEEAEPGWSVVGCADPCRVAAEVFDRESQPVIEALRAARRVRLESESGRVGASREALEAQLAALDWQALSRDELALLPPVLAVESAGELAGRGMVSLSKLLLSGRPVQVLVELDPAADPEADEEPFGGFRFEPAFLGVSLREAFVAQSSLSRPLHLVAGFARAVEGTRSGLHVVAGAGGAARSDLDPSVVAGAAVDSRAHPLFAYDPEAGLSWAERMSFDDNPEPAEDWPVLDLETEGRDGAAETLALPFTFADFALLSGELAAAFRPVPDGVAADGLVPVPEWLALDAAGGAAEEALEKVPFVWAVDEAGRMVRLVISRPLALACRDRLAYWRTLQELAGVKSEYVRRARAAIEEEAAERIAAERERLEGAHAAELERVRREAAEEVADRLTAALLDLDAAAFSPRMGAVGPLAALAGRDADEVSAALLEALGPDGTGAALDESAQEAAPPPAGSPVAQVATELLALIETDLDLDTVEERHN